MSQQLFQFEIHQNGQKLDTLQLDGATAIKIGSHERSQLYINDPEVSRVHAMIDAADGVASIIDLGSGRGTFVNEQRINKHALKSGDRIRVGNTEIVFSIAKANKRGARGAGAPAAPKSVEYARRFLARPAATDGTIEIAQLWKDYVIEDDIFKKDKKGFFRSGSRIPGDPKSRLLSVVKDHRERVEQITIGAEYGATYAIEHPSVKKGAFVLVANPDSPDARLRFGGEMEGELYVEAERYTLREAIDQGVVRQDGDGYAIKFTKDVRLRLNFGPQSLFVHRTQAPGMVIPAKFAIPTALLAAMIFAGLLHLLVVLIGMWMPPDYSMNRNDAFLLDQRFVQVMIQDEMPPEPEMPDWMEEDQQDDGAIVAGEAGQAGDEREEATDNRGTIGSESGSDSDPQLARADAREQALQTGALAALQSFTGGSVFGEGAGSYTDVVAIGGADGVNIGASYGVGGLGAYGGGAATGSAIGGGGGFGIGPAAINRGAAGAGRSGVGIRDREERAVAVVPGRSEIQGQLDREVIERVIRQHRREIVSCYETELQRNPGIEGRVTINFVIDPSGQVARSGIASTTLNNSNVENCITLRVRRWRFPEPKGGGLVTVNYPFTFVSGN